MRIHAEPAIKSVLVTVPLFRQIDDEGLDALAAASTMSELAEGDLLFSEGDPADELTFVMSGSIRLTCGSVTGQRSWWGTFRGATSSARWPSLILHPGVLQRARPSAPSFCICLRRRSRSSSRTGTPSRVPCLSRYGR